MPKLTIPLQQWGKIIADIDIEASLESLSEQCQSLGDLTDYFDENFDLPEESYVDLESEVNMLYCHSIEDRLYKNICSCIETATEHIMRELSPDTYSPINYTTGMSSIPDNFPSVEWEIVEGTIVFTEKSCAPLSLAIMACLQGDVGSYFFGIEEFHYTYCVEDVSDLDALIGWLGEYWSIFGDSRPKADYDNLDCYFDLDVAIKEAAKELNIEEQD